MCVTCTNPVSPLGKLTTNSKSLDSFTQPSSSIPSLRAWNKEKVALGGSQQATDLPCLMRLKNKPLKVKKNSAPFNTQTQATNHYQHLRELPSHSITTADILQLEADLLKGQWKAAKTLETGLQPLLLSVLGEGMTDGGISFPD